VTENGGCDTLSLTGGGLHGPRGQLDRCEAAGPVWEKGKRVGFTVCGCRREFESKL
jgi:hypothetical protein